MKEVIVYGESEFSEWFEKNYEKLGYEKIIRKNSKTFPDFIMLKEGKKGGVELETKSSHFNCHKHNSEEVDEVVCIENDVDLGIKTLIANGISFIPKERITLTVEEELLKWIDKMIEEKVFASRSHAMEYLISREMEKEEKR